MSLPLRRYGCLGWRPDPRDHLRAPRPGAATPGPRADLRDRCPPVWDQGGEGSCTAHALAALVAMEVAAVRGGPPAELSRQALYWGERFREDSTGWDSGAFLRDGLKVATAAGVPLESAWPYSQPLEVRPDDGAWATGLGFRLTSYHLLALGIDDVRVELWDKHPVGFGFSVPASFEGDAIARTGQMAPPEPGERCVGGHAVLAVGYDDALAELHVRNSWGSGWGEDGYFWMPYECWGPLVSEAWAGRA